MELHVIDHPGPGERPPLVIAHGLFGSARNWGAVARKLSAGRRVVAADMRNHGASGWAPEHSYPAMAADLAELLQGFGGPVDLLGHSMGGKAAMELALTDPGPLRRLVVVDIAPVTYGHTQAGVVTALQAMDLAKVERRRDADAELAAHLPDPALRAFLLQSLEIADGAAHWRLALDHLADQMPLIMGFPEHSAVWDGPALFLSGGASEYVADTGAVRRRFPNAEIEVMAGRGHWLHAEDPAGVVAAVERFLDA